MIKVEFYLTYMKYVQDIKYVASLDLLMMCITFQSI